MPQKLFGNIGDVSDAFYQFSVSPLAEWFGLDDPVRAGDFDVSRVWYCDLGGYVDIGPGDIVYAVFEGMPQGWAWALHFCNLAVEYGMSKAIPCTQMICEGLPAPDPRLGPVGSAYVDNVAVFGLVESTVDECFSSTLPPLKMLALCCMSSEGGCRSHQCWHCN